MTSLFQLAPLPLDPADKFLDKQDLPEVQPRFILPELDDHISGPERLLGSLRGTSRYALQSLDLKSLSDSIDHTQSTAAENNTTSGQNERKPEDDPQDDVWSRAVEQAEAGPSRPTFKPIQTWDDTAKSSPFLSESSVFTFDAVVTSEEPMLHLPRLRKATATPVQHSKRILELMISSTMGTTTTEHLRWNSRNAKYVWSADGARPTGVQGTTAASAMEEFLVIGSAIRRLEIIIDEHSTRQLTPTHHALLHALSTYVTFIKHRLSTAIEARAERDISTWNEWISVTQDVRDLSETLCKVMNWPMSGSSALALPSKASSLLSHLHGHLLSMISVENTRHGGSPSTLALAYLLSQSSGPFIALLHAWIGLADSTIQDDDLDPSSQPWSDLGITRTLSRPMDDKWEFSFSSRRIPSFIPKEDRRTLFEAGKSLRLLRDASSGMHPLCAADWGIQSKWDWEGKTTRYSGQIEHHVRRVRREVQHWRYATQDRATGVSMSASIARLRSSQSSRKERKRIPADLLGQSHCSTALQDSLGGADSATPTRSPLRNNIELDKLWDLFSQPPGSHLTEQSHPEISKLWARTPLQGVQDFIAKHSTPTTGLLPGDSPTLPIFVSSHLLAPLLLHSSLISTSLVSLYLDDLRFLDHLDILRAFWLGGDVDFFERVSSALFGKEAGAGEALGLGRRARTRARLGLAPDVDGNPDVEADGEWGIGLGVGLSERAKWPPGGSELAYALRTTLVGEDAKVADRPSGPIWEEVEDRVSFAIKQLPEDQTGGRRAKWLNPQAIEALDFLYLSYSPPSSVAVLLPNTLMEKYQSIHNLLLRLNRCEVVLKSMYWPVLHHSTFMEEPLKTGVDTGLKRQSARVVLKQSRERQRKTLWPADAAVERKVQQLRFRMAHFVTALARYTFDIAIGSKWTIMRRRLERLRRRSPTPYRNENRPDSPSHHTDGDDSEVEEHGYDDLHLSDEEDDLNENVASLYQLRSVHSLVLYHNLTLDRMMRACLLGPQAGQQVTFKILMTLLGLVLDLGKVLVEVDRGLKGWQDGKKKVDTVYKEWVEKEAVFLHALERLSLRTTAKDRDDGEERQGDETERDLRVLLAGENEHGTELDAEGKRGKTGTEANDLQELLLRLRLGTAHETRVGRYADDERL
ncbi:hypothetical protein IAU60_004164 [Kwoniella sp. DSM 27419]